MSDKISRFVLSDEQIEDVTGGNVLYVCTATEHYCWGSHNPDKKYEFQSRTKVKEFIDANYDFYGEAGIFQALMDAGLITPMN